MSMESTVEFGAAGGELAVGVQCHVGKERSENQDRVTRARTPFGDLFVVADGIGGYLGGAEAAQAAVDGFRVYLNAHADQRLPDALQGAAQAIRGELQDRAAADESLHGMGSTAVLCVVRAVEVTYAHVGDSRAYLVRDGQLHKLTRDHTIVERLIAEGVLTPEQARAHEDADILTRAIGSTAEAELEMGELQVRPGDALLLCSDGLWAYASHQEMEIVAAAPGLSAQAVADALLSLALEGGGGDNIGIQFLRFSAPLPAPIVTPVKQSRMKAAVATSLMVVLAIALVGLALWNYRHPLSKLVNGSPVASPRVAIENQPVKQPAAPPTRKSATLQHGSLHTEE